MCKLKHFGLILLMISSFQSVNAQSNELTCYEKAEGEYAYHTELLMHIYETAKISPKEFEKMRQDLISRRDSTLDNCEKQQLAEMDAMVENIQTTTVVHEPTQRSLASVPGGRLPASLGATPNTFQRGAYTEINPSNVSVDYDGENIPEYDGERVSVDN